MAGFADTLPGAEWVGNPVRDAITALPPPDAAHGWTRRAALVCWCLAVASARVH